MTADLTNPIFTNETKAIEHMENDRWPGGEVTCPLCGVVGEARKMGGKTQAGMFLCNACRGKFTVRTGHSVRAVAYPAAQVVARNAPHGVEQEGH